MSDPFSDIDNEVTLDRFKKLFLKYKTYRDHNLNQERLQHQISFFYNLNYYEVKIDF